jgi:hypothetical protein
MKTTSKFLRYAMVLLMVVATAACSTEDGADGPQGPAGADGQAGTNGQDGQDGTNGQDGQDGEDGNANVKAFTYDFTAKTGASINQAIPQLTAAVLEDDVVLAYLEASGVHYQVPNIMNPSGTTFFVRNFMQTGVMEFRFSLVSNNTGYPVPAGTFNKLKVVIIESSSSTSGRNALNSMVKAGVNVENYNEVKAYLNLG